jgi:cytochrome P450
MMINFMVFLIIKRGLLIPNCFWSKISSHLLKDGSGINLFDELSKEGDFININIFGQKVYLVTKTKSVKTILDNSPLIYGVGNLKKRFFNTFMKHNVGVSEGIEWRRRRDMNEHVLMTCDIHMFTSIYNKYMNDILSVSTPSNNHEFMTHAKKIMMKTVFNDTQYKNVDELLDIFKEANSIMSLFNKNTIKQHTIDNFRNFIIRHIKNPIPNSLISMNPKTLSFEETIHQVPHWMFPIFNLISGTAIRVLVVLFNRPKYLKKAKKSFDFTKLCVFEVLRLINPVVTVFRTLLKDHNNFKKGDNFLILNNPMQRKFDRGNEFVPERWTDKDMKNAYNALMFIQGPQKCPGRTLAVNILSAYVFNYINITKFTKTNIVIPTNVPQTIDTCSVHFY